MRPYVFVIVLGVSVASLADQTWRPDRVVDGLKVEYRDVPKSSFHEYRITTESTLPLQKLCDAVWGKNAKVSGDFKKRVVIRESETDRYTYEQVKVPLVKDRDCLMHVKLVTPAETGRCVVKFETVEDTTYPPDPSFVRVPVVRGYWLLDPMSTGRVAITYVIYSEPGGAVPAIFARGGQRDAAVGFMKTILQRATQ